MQISFFLLFLFLAEEVGSRQRTEQLTVGELAGSSESRPVRGHAASGICIRELAGDQIVPIIFAFGWRVSGGVCEFYLGVPHLYLIIIFTILDWQISS